ncbi:MAG: hypothetical protein R3E74_09935 [Pseudomonadales bacterium]
MSNSEIRIKNISETFTGFYLINARLPVYIKYSTSRKGPWVFNFQKAHQEYQQHLFQQFDECITAFVCGKDGIAALTHESMRNVLDDAFDHQESVTIRRKHNEMYRVRGKDGVLEKRVSRSSLADILEHTINLKKSVL